MGRKIKEQQHWERWCRLTKAWVSCTTTQNTRVNREEDDSVHPQEGFKAVGRNKYRKL